MSGREDSPPELAVILPAFNEIGGIAETLARVRDVEIVGEPEYSVQGIGNPITVSLKDLPVRLTAA